MSVFSRVREQEARLDEICAMYQEDELQKRKQKERMREYYKSLSYSDISYDDKTRRAIELSDYSVVPFERSEKRRFGQVLGVNPNPYIFKQEKRSREDTVYHPYAGNAVDIYPIPIERTHTDIDLLKREEREKFVKDYQAKTMQIQPFRRQHTSWS